MSTTQRVLGFVAGLAAVFALGLGLGQLVDLEEPVQQTPVEQTPTDHSDPGPHDETEAPDDDQ